MTRTMLLRKQRRLKKSLKMKLKKVRDDIQKMTDKIIKEIDNIMANKEKKGSYGDLMLIPDVLALPLAEAIARLEAAEIGYTVAAT